MEQVVKQSQMRQEIGETERNIVMLHQRVLDKAAELKETRGRNRKSREFKSPEDEINISEFSKKRFAPQSRRKIMWAVNLYRDWRQNRISILGANVQLFNADLRFLENFNKAELCFALCRFVREVKKLDSRDYPPNTVRELVIMIQMYLHENGVFWKLLMTMNLHHCVMLWIIQ